MSSRPTLGLLLLILAAVPLEAQQPDFPDPGLDTTANPPAEQEDGGSSPLDLSLGLQENNALGAILKGDGLLTSRRAWFDQGNTNHYSVSGFVSYLVDASWNTAEDAHNNASVSLKPTLALNTIQGGNSPTNPPALDPFGYPYLFLDVRQRYGEFESEGEVEEVNQTILGIGLGYRFTTFMRNNYIRVANASKKTYEQPRFEVTWHTVEDSSEEAASLPDGLVADQIRARLSGDIPLYNKRLCATQDGKTRCRWILFADISGTRATEGDNRDWETLYDIGLKYDLLDSNIKPVIHFKSGEEHGLQYDRQLLFGAILGLAGFGG